MRKMGVVLVIMLVFVGIGGAQAASPPPLSPPAPSNTTLYLQAVPINPNLLGLTTSGPHLNTVTITPVNLPNMPLAIQVHKIKGVYYMNAMVASGSSYSFMGIPLHHSSTGWSIPVYGTMMIPLSNGGTLQVSWQDPEQWAPNSSIIIAFVS